MDHPQLFEPGDPLVQRVRELALELPEAVEVEAWGRPTFRAAKPIFVHLGSSMERPHTIVIKTDPEEHRALLQDPRFFSPPYYDRNHWVSISIAEPETDWQFLAELIETSYRQVALKRQIVALDAALGIGR